MSKHRRPGPVSPDLRPSGGRHKARPYTGADMLAEMNAIDAEAEALAMERAIESSLLAIRGRQSVAGGAE